MPHWLKTLDNPRLSSGPGTWWKAGRELILASCPLTPHVRSLSLYPTPMHTKQMHAVKKLSLSQQN